MRGRTQLELQNCFLDSHQTRRDNHSATLSYLLWRSGTRVQEQALCDYIDRLDYIVHSIRVKNIRGAAEFMLRIASDPESPPPPLGKDWVRRFIKRHPRYHKRKQKPLSASWTRERGTERKMVCRFGRGRVRSAPRFETGDRLTMHSAWISVGKDNGSDIGCPSVFGKVALRAEFYKVGEMLEEISQVRICTPTRANIIKWFNGGSSCMLHGLARSTTLNRFIASAASYFP